MCAIKSATKKYEIFILQPINCVIGDCFIQNRQNIHVVVYLNIIIEIFITNKKNGWPSWILTM